jgi:integrase
MPRPKLAEPRYALKRRGRIWTVTWTDHDTGRTRAVSTRTADRAQAEIWRAQFIAGREQPPPPKQPLVQDILDGYLDDRKGVVVAYKRLEVICRTLKRHVGKLEPHMLRRRTYLERRRQERAVADGTIRREVGTLRAAFNWAARERWIAEIPYVQSAPTSEPRERWLSHEEVARLIAACRAPHIRLFVLLAYHTAARTGAILELTWDPDQVDFEHRRIDYRRPGRRSSNKRRATVPLNPVILAALQEARKVATGAGAAHVIEYRGRHVQSIDDGFAAACRRAGIMNCTPHVIRHTAATHMVMAGVPLAEIARMLGDTEAMVEKVYGKHSPDYLSRAAAALAGDLSPRPAVSLAVSEK